jgi:acetyl-CoA C-acetyltransferase
MNKIETVLCYPVRTAIGTYGGSLKDIPAPDLGAAVIRETLKRSGLAADKVQTLVMGNVIEAGVKMNPARQAGIGGGLAGGGACAHRQPRLRLGRAGRGQRRAGNLVRHDRMCHRRRHGEHGPGALPAGAGPQGRWGARMGDVTMFDSMLYDGLNDAFSGQHSGWHTEDLVSRNSISREDQDQWALRSQQRFAAAQAAGKFEGEIALLKCPAAKARPFSARTSTTAPRPLPSRWPSSNQPFARTAPSPPAARLA